MDFIPDNKVCRWAIVNSSISNPSEDDLKEELEYFFRHSDAEHPDAWVSCGTDEGPLYTLTIFRARRTWYGRQICDVEFTKYDDQDMNTELDRKSLGTLTKAATLNLWTVFISDLVEDSQ